MTLPLRPSATSLLALPTALTWEAATTGEAVPALQGTLTRPAPAAARLTVRVHNSAGIPIMEGYGNVQAGMTHFTIAPPLPLGIEAYAHKKEPERIAIAQRIWARRAYASLTVAVTP